MTGRLVLVIAAVGVCGCQHTPPMIDARAELDRRERQWRIAIVEGYDLNALTTFVIETIAQRRVVAGLHVSTKALADSWSVGGATMKSGDWYFNAWEPASDRFSLHTHFWTEQKILRLRCARVSRTAFKVLEVVVEEMRDDLAI